MLKESVVWRVEKTEQNKKKKKHIIRIEVSGNARWPLQKLAKDSPCRQALVSAGGHLCFPPLLRKSNSVPQVFTELSCAMAQHSYCREYRHERDTNFVCGYIGWKRRVIHKKGKGPRRRWTKGQYTRLELKVTDHWRVPLDSVHVHTLAHSYVCARPSWFTPFISSSSLPWKMLPLDTQEITLQINSKLGGNIWFSTYQAFWSITLLLYTHRFFIGPVFFIEHRFFIEFLPQSAWFSH